MDGEVTFSIFDLSCRALQHRLSRTPGSVIVLSNSSHPAVNDDSEPDHRYANCNHLTQALALALALAQAQAQAASIKPPNEYT